ncbi:ABC transporter ATP-binding protein, partial [Chloroflexota bacterium]
ALKGINLSISSGESVVVLGPNGAGKTTLIKILSTIMNPSSGDVSVNGLSLKENAEGIRRSIGVVTHQAYLYHNLTIYENLAFYCRMYDMPAAKIDEKAGMVGMGHRLHDRVGTLSRGMLQRVSIARALLHEPSIMLLDEPETGLDQQAIAMLWGLLRGGSGNQRTVVMTTHNLEHGLNQADRIVIMNRGRIVLEQPSKGLDLAGLKDIYHGATGLEL